MIQKHHLIDEQTSPLQRIMWIYNANEPQRRTFENNVCAFHIGNGYFLSVAHNLRLQAGVFRSIDESVYKKEIYSRLDGAQSRAMDQYYTTDEYTGKRYLNHVDAAGMQTIANILRQKRFDTRWATLGEKKICRPFIVFQFRNNSFYNDPILSHEFDTSMIMYDNDARKHTYLVEVEMVHAFYGADIAIYRIVGQSAAFVQKIPAIEISYDFLDEAASHFYCLQSAPGSAAGRLLNMASVEGMLDHFGIFSDEVGGNYIFEGYRYLIKGYFRFGSSGAPYLYYDAAKQNFVANAIQSEASGIQLSIKNDREGNFQYINAIASPLHIVKNELQELINVK